MITRTVARVALCALIATTALAGCADSGGGPLHRPDLSLDRILAPAIVGLAADGRFGTTGAVGVLERLDPATILADGRLPESPIRDHVATWGDEPPTDSLSGAVRTALQEALAGRSVTFLPIDPAPLAPGDPQCASPEKAGTFVRLAMVPAMAAHGDVFLVILEANSPCGTTRWSAAWVRWEPRDPIGGEWVVGEIIDGGGVSV